MKETYHRPFTLDGHIVGSHGEGNATDHFDHELLTPGTSVYDAVPRDGKNVQIKTTLLVLKMNEDGSMEEVYYGPCKMAGKPSKTGQRHISLKTLRELQEARG